MNIQDREPDHSQFLGEVPRFTIVGSGVIGLLTAHELAEQGHDVTVISAEGQPNRNTDTSSSIAIGQFLPWLPGDQVEKIGALASEFDSIVDQSRQYYELLAKNPHQTGVMRLRNVELVNEALAWPPILSSAMHTELQPLDEPVSIIGGDGETSVLTDEYVFDSFSINTRKTISYLARTAKEKGINFVVKRLKKADLKSLDGIVINATGMGAQELTDDEEIKHYKGHTIILRPSNKAQSLQEGVSVDDLIIVPREDGTIVAGALYIDNPNHPIPEKVEAEELLSRLRLLAKSAGSLVRGLDINLFEDPDIIQHSAGYRVVMQSGGVKVMPDEELVNVLHAYGFAGMGWSVGPAFAKRIASQAIDMHNR